MEELIGGLVAAVQRGIRFETDETEQIDGVQVELEVGIANVLGIDAHRNGSPRSEPKVAKFLYADANSRSLPGGPLASSPSCSSGRTTKVVLTVPSGITTVQAFAIRKFSMRVASAWMAGGSGLPRSRRPRSARRRRRGIGRAKCCRSNNSRRWSGCHWRTLRWLFQQRSRN